MKNKKIQKNRGFTLVELMVATTLFVAIMVMGIGSLVVSSNSGRASQKLRISVDNVNFAMESMTRELRMGTYYQCGRGSISKTPAVGDCKFGENPGDMIAFNPQQTGTEAPRVSYQLEPRENGTNTLERCEFRSTGDMCSAIVSDEVNIKTLKFYVNGSEFPSSNDFVQPSVVILIQGSVTIKGIEKPFTLQTMTSQRTTEK